MTKKVVAIKGNKFIHGKLSEVSKVIRCTPRALNEQINRGKEIMAVNGFVVYLKEWESNQIEY